jgi:pilus assembly protein CpaB
MKQKGVLIVAVLVGLLAFWLTHYYLRQQRKEIYKGADRIQILAAARDLSAGTVLEFGDLGERSEFRTAVGENIFRPEDHNLVLNKKLLFSLKAREPLWWTHVDVPTRAAGGLAPMIKSGMRALSLSLGGDASVSGLVQPDDKVDILGTFSFPSRTDPTQLETVTLTILQDVTVLATGQELARQPAYAGRRGGRRTAHYSTVTFEVTPREAELLVFAQHVKGQLKLTLRNSEDVSYEEDLPEINFEHLEKKLPELNLYRQKNIRHKTEL